MFGNVLSTAVWTYDVRPVDNVDIDTTAIRPKYYTPSVKAYDVRHYSIVSAKIGTYVVRPNSNEGLYNEDVR